MSTSGYPPINTVGQPATIDPPCAVLSPMRAAGMLPIFTVDEPLVIVSGGPAHTQMPPETAAGKLPISTVGMPGGAIGPPMCGTAPVAAGHTCMSLTRAAKGMRRLYHTENST